jgi:hypothetical protein
MPRVCRRPVCRGRLRRRSQKTSLTIAEGGEDCGSGQHSMRSPSFGFGRLQQHFQCCAHSREPARRCGRYRPVTHFPISMRLVTGALRRRGARGPTGFSSVPPPGPAIPVTAIEILAPELPRAPCAISSATSGARRRRSAFSCRIGDADHLALCLVRIGDEAAVDDGRRAGNLRQGAGNQPAGAGFGRGQQLLMFAVKSDDLARRPFDIRGEDDS